MELKDYQQTVLDTLAFYLDALQKKKTLADKIRQANALEADPELMRPVPDFAASAWKVLQEAGRLPKARQSIPFSPRTDGTGASVPSVCFKIPTGGGKTVLAAAAVSRIQSQWLHRNTGFVLWDCAE